MENFGHAIRGKLRSDILEWRSTLQRAASSGVNLLEVYSKTGKSLCWSIYAFLEGFSKSNDETWCHKRAFETAVASLVIELQKLGFDLLDIGLHIQKVVEGIALEVCNTFDDSLLDSRWYILELRYGPRFQDWYIKYVDATITPLEGLADFWNLVESPKIPGAWPQEAQTARQYFEACGRVVLTIFVY